MEKNVQEVDIAPRVRTFQSADLQHLNVVGIIHKRHPESPKSVLQEMLEPYVARRRACRATRVAVTRRAWSFPSFFPDRTNTAAIPPT